MDTDWAGDKKRRRLSTDYIAQIELQYPGHPNTKRLSYNHYMR